MHESLMYAALNASRHPNLGPWRLEDNGCFCLLVADVLRPEVGPSVPEVKVGEIWIGGDEPGGISGTTLASIEGGDCNPVDVVRILIDPNRKMTNLLDYWDNVRSGHDLGVDTRALINKVLDATEHKVTLVSFSLGIDGDRTTYEVQIAGREGTITADQDGEYFDHQGMPTTPAYADGTDAHGDIMELTGKFRQEYDLVFNNIFGVPRFLAQVATEALAQFNA